MPANVQQRLLAFLPDVGSSRHARRFELPWLRFDVVIRQNAKRRNDVFGEVLVLVVAPNQDEVGLEFVERFANLTEPVQKFLAMTCSRRLALIVSILFPH